MNERANELMYEWMGESVDMPVSDPTSVFV